MKVLVIAAHPNLESSRINKAWINELKGDNTITLHNLYEVYPDEKIDVASEQELLLKHDRIVFQFPFYWYSSPSLLKKWQDEVLEYGFAYGSTGTKLHGKEFMLVTSIGGPEDMYQAGGYNVYSLNELTKPFQAMANLTGMTYLPAFLLYGVRTITDEALKQNSKDLVMHLKNTNFRLNR